MATPYKFMSEEQREIIRQRNLKYYHDNKNEIKKRTKIYWKEYYKKNQQKMLDRQKKYHKIQTFYRGDENYYNEQQAKAKLNIPKIIICEVAIGFD